MNIKRKQWNQNKKEEKRRNGEIDKRNGKEKWRKKGERGEEMWRKVG